MNARNDWLESILLQRRPMTPQPTGISPRLKKLPGIRAVIFDIYGTLVISGSGDVGSANEQDSGNLLADAFEAIGVHGDASELPGIDQLQRQIRQLNEAATRATCIKPEVDIVEVWRQVLRSSGHQELADQTELVVRLAAEYESRANPTWPMPGASALLSRLAESGCVMGIVSNAQVFTANLVEDLVDGLLDERGFDLNLCVFSYRFRHAKPSPLLFEVLTEGLQRRGIEGSEAVYVGNDMLNDVWTASQAGLRTAWFAGDARSCRERPDDARCQSLSPDVVLTDLNQVLECVGE